MHGKSGTNSENGPLKLRYQRHIQPIDTESFFLFGARGTGKTAFLREFFKAHNALWIDLLNEGLEERLTRSPGELEQMVLGRDKGVEWIVIDEVQKIPSLLNTVHRLIESDHGVRFALTGSSARKLKRGAANLLAGRAFVNNLFPLTHLELGKDFRINDALQYGTLPKSVTLKTTQARRAFLKSYALTYLKEEIWAEHIVERLPPFRRFLELAARANAQIVNYKNIARDCGINEKTVKTYFQILEDTLIGFILEPYHKGIRKRQRHNPKFYFFDLGIKRALEHSLATEITPGSYDYGALFESFVVLEANRFNHYFDNDFSFSYLRTGTGAEIDLIIERPGQPIVLVEIKSSKQVDERDTRVLESFLPSFPKALAYCLSQDPITKTIGSVRAVPWERGLNELFINPFKN